MKEHIVNANMRKTLWNFAQFVAPFFNIWCRKIIRGTVRSKMVPKRRRECDVSESPYAHSGSDMPKKKPTRMLPAINSKFTLTSGPGDFIG
ncbi:hypothetical protein ABEB36_005089 [Hypothenemus hampei]|uniref:Uncharacterized protein n=1 Tax=Hypothenemus hampei TaxID=57062 RepID=A0ABD1EWZ7_HYPHA